jgi:hypothetical protein
MPSNPIPLPNVHDPPTGLDAQNCSHQGAYEICRSWLKALGFAYKGMRVELTGRRYRHSGAATEVGSLAG